MKKIAFLLVVFCLISTSVFSVYAEQTITDPAEYLSSNGILTGSNGDLMLDSNFNVEQLMVILARLTGEEDIAKNYKKLTTFTDVPKNKWSQPFISWAQNKGLLAGSGGGKSGYLDTVTAKRLVAFMLRILGYTDVGWNDVFNYGKNLGLLNLLNVSPNDELTRGQMAKIVYNTLGTNIKDGGKLSDKLGLKDVQTTTKTNNSGADLEPSDIADTVGPSVCYIEVSDSSNKPFATGSGFVINKSGIIVTNYHVIDGAYYAKVKFSDGRSLTVDKVLAYDENRDIAILKLSGSNPTEVKLGDSSTIKSGQKILTIGSPEGLENTISDGLISNRERTLGGQKYIQISAPISSGSSGGVLLNYKGEVIGITCAYFVDGQNLNLAIPINDLKPMINTNLNIALSDLVKNNKPIAPKNVRVKVFNCSANIGWDNVSGADGYKIYISSSIDGPYTLIPNGDDPSSLYEWMNYEYSATCSFLISDKQLYFKLKTVKNGVESDYSAPVGISIPLVKYFPKLSDVPLPVGIDYVREIANSENTFVSYFYSDMDVLNYVRYLRSAGFVYRSSEYDEDEFFMERGDTVILFTRLEDDGVQITGEVH